VDTNVDPIAWYSGNSGGTSHPVGQKQPNAWGLYDMAGNVFEWCHDGYQDQLQSSTDPYASGKERVIRGGGWYNGPGTPRAVMLLFLLMTLALFVVGIGQLGYREWERLFAVRWSITALIIALLLGLLVIPELLEGTRSICEQVAGRSQRCPSMGLTDVLLCILALGAYPVTQLFYFASAPVTAAMRS
jgi:hypothetical protein